MRIFKSPSSETCHLTLAMILLRIWLGMRSLFSGIEKFGGSRQSEVPVVIDGATNSYGLTEAASQKVYSIANYNGIPAALADKFASEPLIPGWFLSVYNVILGPLLILLGIALLLGIASRLTLFAMGLLYTSLSFGLILLKQDAGVAWLATHIILVVIALALTPYNRFEIFKRG